MDRDGLGYLILGSPESEDKAKDAGFVLWGRAVGGGIDLADPFTAGGVGFAIKGQVAGDIAGYAMTSIGDLNGDGVADVLISASGCGRESAHAVHPDALAAC